MDLYGYLFAGLCIVVYAWSRFNTPATWRSTTTSWQYMLALAGYVLAALALWFVLARLVTTNPQLVSLLAFGNPAPAEPDLERSLARLSGLSAPLLAALFLTTLLPRLPILVKIDIALQRAFRELGAIPHKARQLSNLLRRAPFAVPAEDQAEVRRRLKAQGLDSDRLLQSPHGSIEGNWVRIVALMARLEEVVDLSDDPMPDDPPEPRRPVARSDFLRHREVEYAAARAAYRQQAAIAAVLLTTRLEVDDARLAQALLNRADVPDLGMHGLQQSFHDGCKRLLKELTHLISCGMLQSSFSLSAACRELRTWGFGALAPEPRGISVNDLIGVMLSITLYLFVLFLYVHRGAADKMGHIPVLALSIGLTMTAAVVCAVYAKRLPIAGAAGRNFAVYLVAGSLAIGGWFVIQYVRIMLMTGGDVGSVLHSLKPWSPIAAVPFAAAFTLAWLTDLRPERWSVSIPALRWLEGLGLAAVLAGTASVAFIYVRSFLAAEPQKGPPPDLHTIVMIQAGLGFLIGVLVPHLYRRAMTEGARDDRRRGDDAATAIPARAALPQGAD
jgi:hypothetical protein